MPSWGSSVSGKRRAYFIRPRAKSAHSRPGMWSRRHCHRWRIARSAHAACGCSFRKAEWLVGAGARPAHHSATRTKLIAVAVSTCCRSMKRLKPHCFSMWSLSIMVFPFSSLAENLAMVFCHPRLVSRSAWRRAFHSCCRSKSSGVNPERRGSRNQNQLQTGLPLCRL